MLAKFLRSVALGTVLTSAAVAAHAALIVTTGNSGSLTDKNVVSASCTGGANGPALSITGCLNGLPTSLVRLTAEENIEFGAGGQADTESSDGNGFSTLRIALVGGGLFQSLVLNIDALDAGTVAFNDGTNFSSNFSLAKNGNNFFTITGGSFSFIEFTTYGSPATAALDLIDAVKQMRIGTADVLVPVPAPLTALLIGAGFAGMGLARAARRRTD